LTGRVFALAIIGGVFIVEVLSSFVQMLSKHFAGKKFFAVAPLHLWFMNRGWDFDHRAIRCPVNLLAGATDHITPPAQAFALADAVSTPPEDIVRRVTSGGHLGLFMGREALRDHWPAILAGVYERSHPLSSPAVV